MGDVGPSAFARLEQAVSRLAEETAGRAPTGRSHEDADEEAAS